MSCYNDNSGSKSTPQRSGSANLGNEDGRVDVVGEVKGAVAYAIGEVKAALDGEQVQKGAAGGTVAHRSASQTLRRGLHKRSGSFQGRIDDYSAHRGKGEKFMGGSRTDSSMTRKGSSTSSHRKPLTQMSSSSGLATSKDRDERGVTDVTDDALLKARRVRMARRRVVYETADNSGDAGYSSGGKGNAKNDAA
ncbi:hypothetical protein SISNIDRAFT_483013 [Sistotremastrum niveocremeum HHB9708]|uniref:Uncharacterized protein n=1 Tax=Sistotremastrum niveocremeum HHB9708 TaxID=1314777 RepID=A0A164Y058_9AGAM|nr:hypothetical protein SISNIDRAFT_483013 [Sistotremastrum niveocremeum HHB9708]